MGAQGSAGAPGATGPKGDTGPAGAAVTQASLKFISSGSSSLGFAGNAINLTLSTADTCPSCSMQPTYSYAWNLNPFPINTSPAPVPFSNFGPSSPDIVYNPAGPSFTVDTAGTYSISLKVTDLVGNSASPMLVTVSCGVTVNNAQVFPLFATQLFTNSNLPASLNGSLLVSIPTVPANVGLSCQQNQPLATVVDNLIAANTANVELIIKRM
jgi:hypothetical protein